MFVSSAVCFIQCYITVLLYTQGNGLSFKLTHEKCDVLNHQVILIEGIHYIYFSFGMLRFYIFVINWSIFSSLTQI